MLAGAVRGEVVPTAYHEWTDSRYSRRIHPDQQVQAPHKRSEEQWVVGNMSREGRSVAAWQVCFAYLAWVG